MQKSLFKISQMDCPSEENLIRMQLQEHAHIKKLDFDIPNRTLAIFHDGAIAPIEASILALNLGGQILSTEETTLVG